MQIWSSYKLWNICIQLMKEQAPAGKVHLFFKKETFRSRRRLGNLHDGCIFCLYQAKVFSPTTLGQFTEIKVHVKCNQMDNLNGELQINFSLLQVQRMFIEVSKWFTETKCLISKDFFSYSELNNLEQVWCDRGHYKRLVEHATRKTPLIFNPIKDAFQIFISELQWQSVSITTMIQ